MLMCLAQIFEDSIKLQSIWTNAREQLEKGELRTPEHSTDEEEEKPQPKVAAVKSSTKKKKSKKDSDAESTSFGYFTSRFSLIEYALPCTNLRYVCRQCCSLPLSPLVCN